MTPSHLLLLLSLLLFTGFGTNGDSAGLRLAAFNVQIFGTKKASNSEIISILAQIVRRYDVILIQEIRDNSDTAVKTLLTAVNNLSNSDGYRYVISERLGRTPSKEQYAYFYRVSSIASFDTFQYNDSSDSFQRPPFCFKFRSPKMAVNQLILVGIHTEPDRAFEEINALVPVYQTVTRYWATDNVLIMGDLNAGCSYVSKKKLSQLDLRRDNQTFTWLIGDNVDTTTGSSNCPYDRFIASGNDLKKNVPSKGDVYHFDDVFKLNREQTLNVSDHYPIELQLRSSVIASYSAYESNGCSSIDRFLAVSCFHAIVSVFYHLHF